MKVSRSRFYVWRKAQAIQPSIDPDRFQLEVDAREIFAQSDDSYGSRRMAKALRSKGYDIGRYQARTFMRQLGLQVRTANLFYNNDRLHSYLDYMSPVEFERQELKKAA